MADFLERPHISKRFGGVTRCAMSTCRCGPARCIALSARTARASRHSSRSSPACCSRSRAGDRHRGASEYPHLNPVQSTRCGIQVIYQDLSLFPNLTVAENIAVGRPSRRPPQLWTGAAMRATAEAAMARVGVALDPDARVEDLTIAKRQLVAICRAMAADASSSSWTSRRHR